jgi:hypothetical protein
MTQGCTGKHSRLRAIDNTFALSVIVLGRFAEAPNPTDAARTFPGKQAFVSAKTGQRKTKAGTPRPFHPDAEAVTAAPFQNVNRPSVPTAPVHHNVN